MAGPTALPLPGPGFEARKSKILEQLAVPDAEYSDASPKGTVDVGIRPLLAKVNATVGFVTTSSCAGRVSVFVEGRKTAAAQRASSSSGANDVAGADEDDGHGPPATAQLASTQTVAGLGGKGGGGTWLYVSHDPHPMVAKGVVVDWVLELGISAGQGGDDASLLDATGGSGGGGDSQRRLIHFKFEPMVS